MRINIQFRKPFQNGFSRVACEERQDAEGGLRADGRRDIFARLVFTEEPEADQFSWRHFCRKSIRGFFLVFNRLRSLFFLWRRFQHEIEEPLAGFWLGRLGRLRLGGFWKRLEIRKLHIRNRIACGAEQPAEDAGDGDFPQVLVDTADMIGRRGADIRNAKGLQPVGERHGAGAFDGGQQFRGVFRAEDAWRLVRSQIESGKLILRQIIDIQRFVNKTAFDEGLRDYAAEGLQIQRVAGGEVFDAADVLRRALHVEAAPCHKLRIAFDRAAAGRAFSTDMLFEIKRFRIRRPFGENDFHDGRNDLSGLFDEHGVADADVLPADVVFVVEGGAADGGSSQRDRLQFRDGCEDARPPDLHRDGPQQGGRAFGGVFEGFRPAWCMCRHAKDFPLVKTIDFDDGAIRVIGERIADSVEFFYGGEDAFQAVDGTDPFLDFQAEPLECLEKLRLAADVQADDFAAGVEKDVQRTFRDLPRVQLLEAAGRCVSCICEFLFVVRKAVGVEFQEACAAHVDFAAGFENRRRIGDVETERDGRNRADIGRDVIPLFAVAARKRLHEKAVLIADGNADAVDLRFDKIRRHVAAEAFDDVFVKTAEVVRVIRVVEAHHGQLVADGLESRERIAGDALRRRIRRDELRMGGFDLPKLAIQRIIFVVGYFRFRFDVIEMVMPSDFGAKEVELLLDGLVFHGESVVL